MSPVWPKSVSYRRRFQVEDLIPSSTSPLRALFIGESPHRDEVAPEKSVERSPFRGIAGRAWWRALSELSEVPLSLEGGVPSRAELLQFCSKLRIGVMNAIQYPMDPKICLHQGVRSAPAQQLGFAKGSGPRGYKKVFRTEAAVSFAIQNLTRRLKKVEKATTLVCLGNDARWFVEKTQTSLPILSIPHPSSWWRNAAYRKRALDVLQKLIVQA